MRSRLALVTVALTIGATVLPAAAQEAEGTVSLADPMTFPRTLKSDAGSKRDLEVPGDDQDGRQPA